MSKRLLVTGSSGLIGSEVCAYFTRELGYTVHGVDNNQRAVFFGPQGDARVPPLGAKTTRDGQWGLFHRLWPKPVYR